MFGFGKKKKLAISTPVKGKIIDITEVGDEVFASRTMGDGFAVEPEGDTLVAPCDGMVAMVADTLHAVVIEKDGVQILLHIGLDTVELQGKGFKALVLQGDMVRRGDALMRFDRARIGEAGKPLTTMLVIANMDVVASLKKDLSNPEEVLSLELKN